MMNKRQPMNSNTKAAWKPSLAFIRTVEENAAGLRSLVSLGPTEAADAHAIATRLGILVVSLDDIRNLSRESYNHLVNVDASVWSGMSVPLAEGQFVVLLHPRQTRERANVTLAEEAVHVYLKHSPSQLIRNPDGTVRRVYDEAVEREAYWTAAATLLPSKAVAQAVWHGCTVEAIASKYNVSIELVQFRIKVLRLWRHKTT